MGRSVTAMKGGLTPLTKSRRGMTPQGPAGRKGGHILGVSALKSHGIYAAAASKEYGSPTKLNSTTAPSRRSAAVEESDSCFPALVSVSNDKDEYATKVNVSVVDFPGLLRVVSWVLTGLGLVVDRADISTTDGMASQEFYVTDLAGKKVEDPKGLADRISQFVQHCVPDEDALQATKFREGRIVIDNAESENFTVISIDSGERDAPGLLLSIASTISALGITIDSASICTECQHFTTGRYFRFEVHKIGGKKLDYVDASGALFTLNLVINSSTTSTLPSPIHASRLH